MSTCRSQSPARTTRRLRMKQVLLVGPTMATALSPAAVASTFWVVAGLVAPEAQSVSPGLRSSPLLAEDGRPLAERT